METDVVEDVDGSIHSIHVRNFFCHDNLEINFNRNVNFIVGRNGSGKSAILTALVVGLGARASATNRGSSLNSFIKKGANSASVEIKIKNNSAKAYKYNIYGDHITIIRNINSSGGSSYKIKAASGEVISTKYEEVNAITLAHDIQVDNPISVLNQDDARSFHASDAKKKYALFRKATNLDQTEANYVRALDNCNKSTEIWNRKKDACAELEKEYKKWKTSYEQMQSRDEMETQKQLLQNEYYWSEIADFEREMNTIQVQYDKQKARIDRLVDKLEKMNQNYGNNTDVIDTLKKQLEEKSMEKRSLEQELTQLESQIREVQTEWRSAQTASGKQVELLNREKRKIADITKEIENIESGSAARERAQMEQRSEEAREAAKGARARYDTAQHDAHQARQHHAHAAAQLQGAEQARAAATHNIRQLKQQLRELQSRGNDSLGVYGNNMVELKQRVKQAAARGEFSAEPRGPVGSYLKVKDKKWGGALEHIIGRSLQTFCVNTNEDSMKLFQIMAQVYGKAPKPAVTCSKFLTRAHDVSKRNVRARSYSSALNALQVSDVIVTNYLIDNLALETVLLVPNPEDAVRLADTEENVPENCSKIVTLDSTEYNPAPNYRSYGGVARPSRYLHLSTAEKQKQVQAELAEAEAKAQRLQSEAERWEGEAEQASKAEREADRVLQALLRELHAKEAAARHAANALDKNHAPHHAVLLDELKISKEKVSSLQTQVAALSAKEEAHGARVEGLEASMRRAKAALATATAALRALGEEIEQEQLKLEQGATERSSCQQRLRDEQGRAAQLEAVLAQKGAALQAKEREALQLCPRLDNPRDLAIVTNELKKTQLKLSSIRDDGLTKAQVAEKLLHVERKCRRTQQTLHRLQQLIADIKNTADKHLSFCYSVQTSLARRVQFCFQSILNLRGYSGSMKIDNGRGVLEMQCAGRESSGKRAAASTSSLSGGERSYSTVAFIMALWDCVELPFYFMDEFDVFMDNVNRKIVMELLIDHALKNTNRQFVFLTPQDASAVNAGPQISIHLMADPRP